MTFIDGDQKIEAVLDDGVRDDGAKITTQYVLGQQQGIIAAVDQIGCKKNRKDSISVYNSYFRTLVIQSTNPSYIAPTLYIGNSQEDDSIWSIIYIKTI